MPQLVVPTLTDGVVTLRAHTEDDVEGCWEQCNDPVSIAWTTVPVPYGRDDAKAFVREVMPIGWATDEEWGFAVEAEGRYAGTVSLRNEREGRAEIAYGSHPWVRGTGYVERALRLLVEWGFAEQGLRQVVWWANEGNWTSRKTAWRIGFSFDGTVRGRLPQRGQLLDAWVGTLLASDAREPRNPWFDVPRIVGERVVLRIHRADEATRVQEACADERTAHWLGRIPVPYTAAHAERFLLLRSMGMAAGTDLHWIMADPGDDRLLGTVSLMHVDGSSAEVGYWTHPDARGRGVMSEAVRLACRHAFVGLADGGLGLTRLEAYAAVDNAASRHVLESAGFRPTGVRRQAGDVRGERQDLAGYDLLPGDLSPR